MTKEALNLFVRAAVQLYPIRFNLNRFAREEGTTWYTVTADLGDWSYTTADHAHPVAALLDLFQHLLDKCPQVMRMVADFDAQDLVTDTHAPKNATK